MDTFLSITAANDDLADTSFLTQLDMDPAGEKMVKSPSSATLQSPSSVPGHVLPNLLTRVASTDGGMDLRSETPKAFGELRRLVSFARGRD